MKKSRLDRLVERRHPAYDDNEKHWTFLDACYSGERTWFDDHIHPYYKEGSENYADRVKRAYRFNHSREVVDLVNKYLFRGKVIRNTDDAPECLVQFWKDSTGKGVDIGQYSKNVSKRTSIVGRTWTVVDSTVMDGELLSKRDEKKGKGRVYSYIVPPEDVLDMSYDSQGKLNWILIREKYRNDTDPFDFEDECLTISHRYRLWTRDKWHLYVSRNNNDVKSPSKVLVEEDSGTHGLGMVPVTWCDHMESDELYVTPSLISDIAYLDRAVANYLSNLDVIIQDQTFSQLAMPAQGLMPGDDGEAQLKKIGTKQMFTYDGEAGQVPFYLSPDVAQANLIMDVIQKVINEIYHTIGMAGERTKQDNAVGTDNSSGVAKAYDFERVNAMLVSKASALDQWERRLSIIVCAYHQENLVDLEEDLIKYPDDFDIRGLADEFDIAANLMELSMPPLVRRKQAEQLVEALFPRASIELKGELQSALDEWPEDPVELQARMTEATSPPDMGVGGNSKTPTKTGSDGIRRESRQGQVTEETK